ncbi:hypothetical protein [Cupriavidus necator]
MHQNGSAEIIGKYFSTHSHPTDQGKILALLSSAQGDLQDYADKIHVTVQNYSHEVGAGNRAANSVNVILYKGRGVEGELAVKFVNSDGTPNINACNSFIREMGPKFSVFARTYPDQPGIIFNAAYKGGSGELAVKFADQATRDKFYERLNLTTGHAIRYSGQQSATLYFNPALHPTSANQRPNMRVSYTPSPVLSRRAI